MDKYGCHADLPVRLVKENHFGMAIQKENIFVRKQFFGHQNVQVQLVTCKYQRTNIYEEKTLYYSTPTLMGRTLCFMTWALHVQRSDKLKVEELKLLKVVQGDGGGFRQQKYGRSHPSRPEPRMPIA